MSALSVACSIKETDENKCYILNLITTFCLNGANLNHRDAFDCTPLHHAVTSENYSALNILLNKENLDVNSQAIGGKTALMKACETGNEKITLALLEAKCDPTITDRDGK